MGTPASSSRDERSSSRSAGDLGAGLVEYALLLALIVVVCIGAVTFFGSSLDSNLSKSTSQVVSAGP